ncbi:MAG: YARHG domain-containing protein [Ignavibacteria bacterium]|nr:YARHG domain-containing protein [Ignavibacteria bacterium]
MKSNFRKIFIVIFFSKLLFAQSEFNVRLYNSDKILQKDEVLKFLPVERELIQSEILANYGYIFDDTLLQRYFLKQIWYEPKTKEFPQLKEIDSINFSLLYELNKNNERTCWENVKKFRPILDDIQKSYFSYCFENSNYKSIAKRRFKLKPFNYCFRQVFYIPRLELPVGVWDFERFFAEEDFDVKEYAFFKWANDVRGILFRGYFSKDGKLLQLDEVGVDPGLNLGKVVTENYLDSLGRIFVHYNLDCRDSDIKKIARILDYDDKSIKKEVLLLEDDEYLYVQISTKEYFIETGLRKKK